MKIAIQMDSPERLNPKGDSTIVLIREAARRGYQLFYYHPASLSYSHKEVVAPLQRLSLNDHADHWFTLDKPCMTSLHEMDVVLMRQDPPFDMGYITATYFLDRLHQHTLVLNHPTAVRSHTEKMLPLDYADAMPDTLISPHTEEIIAFVERHGDIILKPLYGWGGHAVLRLRKDGDNLLALLELLKRMDSQPIIAQPFLPAVTAQDIRVVIINGKIAGSFARLPASGEIRANMRVGGTPVAIELNPVQQALVERITPDLKAKGLYLAGLDLIGNHLTEINVTSPTGLRTLEILYQSNPAQLFWDGVEQMR